MNMIGMITVAFFAVIGAATFITALVSRNETDEKLYIILDDLRADSAEIRIRSAARLCDRIRCQKLICRCEDEESQQICERLMKEYRMIEIG